jgi:plastocyanin
MKGRGPKISLLVAVAALGVWATVAGARDSAGAAATKRVSIRDDFFSPKRITISAGDRVKWTWRESDDHNVRFRKVPRGVSRKPGSRTQFSGTFTRTFRKRGTYRYVCTIHEDLGMTGSVKVE